MKLYEVRVENKRDEIGILICKEVSKDQGKRTINLWL